MMINAPAPRSGSDQVGRARSQGMRPSRRRAHSRSRLAEHRGQELTGSWGAGQIDQDRAAIRFNRDGEAKKPAALALGINRAGDGQESVVAGDEAQAVATFYFESLFGTADQVVEHALSANLQRGRAQRAGDRKIGQRIKA
jgi:hypothetical protein